MSMIGFFPPRFPFSDVNRIYWMFVYVTFVTNDQQKKKQPMQAIMSLMDAAYWIDPCHAKI